MSFNSSFSGCPVPFLAAANYTGGFIEGRYCSSLLGESCCLPCPSTEWLYPDNFNTVTTSIEWVNVAGMACSAFLLASFVFVPVEKTHRHYLSICLAVAVALMQLGFIIPLGAKPEQCYDAITPNDMHTSRTCALSGALVLAGGWSAVMWVFLRSVALHLQICWQVVIGKVFMWSALATGWGIPAIGITIALTISGVSFRFGDTCHINHKDSLVDFWIPLLVFAGLTVIVQFVTFGYCIRVYLASLGDQSTTTEGSGLPSYSGSVRETLSPRQAYRRIRRVIELQWRGIAIVLLIIGDVIFFAVVFVFMDDAVVKLEKNPLNAAAWLECLIESDGKKNECLNLTGSIVVNLATVAAVLLLLSMNGIWSLVFLGRFSMFIGWYEMIWGKIRPNNEFISADARVYKDPRSYEMLSRDRDRDTSKTPEPLISPVTPLSPTMKSGRETPDYFGREARYKSPSRSFSSPKPPQSWDSTATYASASPVYMDPLSMNKL